MFISLSVWEKRGLIRGDDLRRAGIKSQIFFERRQAASFHCPADGLTRDGKIYSIS